MNLRNFQAIAALSLMNLAVACGSDDSGAKDAAQGGTASTNSSAGGASSTSSASNIGGSSAPSSNGGSTTTSGNTTLPAANSPLAGKLYINELVPSNKAGSGAVDESGASPDWLELYNASDADISLAGFFMSDQPDNPTQAVLATDLVVKAKSTLLLWADGDVDQSILHLPFKLSATGEIVYLYDRDLKLIDSVEFPQANPNASYSRLPDGTGAFTWCSKGTPSALNGTTCAP
jgi:hypothetical protein